MLQCVAVPHSLAQVVLVARLTRFTYINQCVPETDDCLRVLQCVAVCCSVLQCVAVCCSVLQCVAVCCIELQCVAVCPRDRGVKLGPGCTDEKENGPEYPAASRSLASVSESTHRGAVDKSLRPPTC